MARPMSPEQRELLDIITEHGPIDLSGLCARTQLSSGRVAITERLGRLRASGLIVRGADKRWVTVESAEQRSTVPASAATLGDPRWPAPRTAEADTEAAPPRSVADIARKHLRLPRPHDDLVAHMTPLDTQRAAALAEQSLQALAERIDALSHTVRDLLDELRGARTTDQPDERTKAA